MDSKVYHLKEFEFIDPWEETSWTGKMLFPIRFLMGSVIRKIYGTPSYNIPIRFKDESKRDEKVSLTVLGGAIGFNSSEMTGLLSYHEDQYQLYRIVRSIVYYSISAIFLICFCMTILIFYHEYTSLYELYKNTPLFIPYIVLIFSVFLLFLMVITGLFVKISFLLSDSKYTGTLCARTVIYVIIQLSFDDVLSNSRHRKALLNSMHSLAQNTLLLPRHYFSHDDASHSWAQKHFKHMERYIRERERWVLAPTTTTLISLRQDFQKLSYMYLSGDYGNFLWQSDIALPEDRPPT
jgi:hypothetical protein